MAANKSTVKKLDDNVIKALTRVCEEAKAYIEGFAWLTHRADYSNFPGSLVVTCVFVDEQQLDAAKSKQQDALLRKSVHKQLLKAGILLKDPRRHVFFDSEEACQAAHRGDWEQRLSR